MNPFWRRIGFPLGLLLLCVFKFWLVHTEEIYGREAQHDEIWFLNSASHWYWWTPYNWSAFARPPAYPLFIATVHLFAIPLRIAIELLQMAGYLTLIAGLRRAGVTRVIALSIFATLVLHPASFQLNNYAGADTFYAATLAFVLGGFLLIWVGKSKMLHASWTGAALAVLWTTRDESLLLPPLIVAFALLTFYLIPREQRARREVVVSRIVAPCAALLGVLIILLLAVNTANYFTFRGFSSCEIASPGFKAAHRALLRIKPSQSVRYVAVTNEALQMAYQVSPTFAALRKEFEGQLGRDWQQETLNTYGIRNEIGTCWFRWALRAIAGSAGFHQSGAQADQFYRQISREINQACDRGEIPSRRVFSAFCDPDTVKWLRYMPNSFGKHVERFAKKHRMIVDRADWNLNMQQSEFYDEMAGRRAALTRFGRLQIIGWAFQFGDPVKLVFYRDEGGGIWSSTARFSDRPDVVAQFQGQGEVRPEMQFILTVDLFRKAIPSGELVFVTRSGKQFSGPLASVLNRTPPTANGAALMHFIDSHKIITKPPDVSVAAENLIGKRYPSLVLALSFAGLAALSLFIIYRRKLQWNALNAVLILLQFVFISRLLLLSFIDATSWFCVHDRFLLPIMPLYSCFLILLLYQAVRLMRPASVSATPGF